MQSRGKLKIFLGYAAGVGKTYQMLTEARQMIEDGRDVVIGYFEPHGRRETIALTEGIEFVPRKIIEHRGAVFEEMDTGAVLARHPGVAAVDEFAHTNVPGSERLKRWQDIMVILDAGIDVLSSLNVQHIESLNDQVWHVTGIRVRETVPDWVVQEADEVVMVDVTPRALLHRLERGVVYAPEKAQKAIENFFTESNLTALRELAMRQTAHHLEEKREHTGRGRGIAGIGDSSAAGTRSVAASGGISGEELRAPQPVQGLDSIRQERILLWLTPHPSTAMLIRRGRRVADYLGAPCTAVYAENESAAIEPYLNFCRNLRIDARAIDCLEPPRAVAEYARENAFTQVYVTRNAPDLSRLVNLARDIQVTIVAERVHPG